MTIERFMGEVVPRWAVRLTLPLMLLRVVGWFIDTNLTERIFKISLIVFFIPVGISWCIWNIFARKQGEAVALSLFGKTSCVRKEDDPISFLAYNGAYWIVILGGSLFELGVLSGFVSF
jgi:hypothetical protein